MIAIDTHVWVWRANEIELSDAAMSAIAEAGRVLVSAASCLEVATLVRRGRIELDRGTEAWIRQALSEPEIEIADIDLDIAYRAGTLPHPFPGDPADRLIYATAVARGVPLITADRAIREFDPARTIW